jgi:hypothetical protein
LNCPLGDAELSGDLGGRHFSSRIDLRNPFEPLLLLDVKVRHTLTAF